jgi:hypothetical protein
MLYKWDLLQLPVGMKLLIHRVLSTPAVVILFRVNECDFDVDWFGTLINLSYRNFGMAPFDDGTWECSNWVTIVPPVVSFDLRWQEVGF